MSVCLGTQISSSLVVSRPSSLLNRTSRPQNLQSKKTKIMYPSGLGHDAVLQAYPPSPTCVHADPCARKGILKITAKCMGHPPAGTTLTPPCMPEPVSFHGTHGLTISLPPPSHWDALLHAIHQLTSATRTCSEGNRGACAGLGLGCGLLSFPFSYSLSSAIGSFHLPNAS